MRRPSVEQAAAALVAAVFLLAGVLGLVPGVTTHHGALRFAGSGSHAQLFGVFQVSILLDLVHVSLGVAGLVLLRTAAGARVYLRVGAVVSLVLWLLGAADVGGRLPLDTADDWLHLVLACVMLGAGAAGARGARPAAVSG